MYPASASGNGLGHQSRSLIGIQLSPTIFGSSTPVAERKSTTPKLEKRIRSTPDASQALKRPKYHLGMSAGEQVALADSVVEFAQFGRRRNNRCHNGVEFPGE